MSDPLHLIVPPKVKIRSWKDLLRETECLVEDLDDHKYHGYRTDGKKYSANVKVDSHGDAETALDKLGVVDPIMQATLEEDFDMDTTNSLFNEWISDSAEYLKEWFSGCAHDTPEYLEKHVVQRIERGEPTCYPHLEQLKTKHQKLKEVRKWQVENALFREAFDASDASLIWEGSSGGYVTWDPCYDLSYAAGDIVDSATDAVNGDEPSLSFRDALSEFRVIERIHNLNLALIDYLEKWAGRMHFQDELDYIIQQRFDEMGGNEKASAFEKYGDLVVTFDDSIKSGNCISGTWAWIEKNLGPDRATATIRELLAIDDMKAVVRRLCRFVIRRHMEAQEA